MEACPQVAPQQLPNTCSKARLESAGFLMDITLCPPPFTGSGVRVQAFIQLANDFFSELLQVFGQLQIVLYRNFGEAIVSDHKGAGRSFAEMLQTECSRQIVGTLFQPSCWQAAVRPSPV